MAKPYIEITKTDFKDNYNVVKVLTNKQDIMEYLNTQYKESKDNAVAFGIRKRSKVSLEDVLLEMRNGFKQVNARLDKVEARLDIIEDKLVRNNIN